MIQRYVERESQLGFLIDHKSEELIAWWNLLNKWKWPKGIHEPAEAVGGWGNPRRRAFMDAIERELGQRRIQGKE